LRWPGAAKRVHRAVWRLAVIDVKSGGGLTQRSWKAGYST
jgi:hypothetical protein